MLFAVLVPLALLSILSAAKTAQQEEIKRAGATSSEIQVTSAKPLDTESRGRGLRWEVTGTTQHNGESRTLRGELDSYGQIRPGTTLWARYAPDDPKAGVILSTTESALTVERDGPLQQLTFVLLTLATLVLTIVRATVYGSHGRDLTESTVANSVYAGSALVLRVRITGLRTSRTQRAAALRLTAVEGDRELLLGPWVDVDLLADDLEGREAWMYWKQSPDRGGGPWGHLRSVVGTRDGLPCVLVLDDGTYLKGHTPAVHDGYTPPGYAIGRIHVPGAPVVRPVETVLLRRPRVRPLRLLCYGLAVALVTAMLFLPAGEYVDFDGAGLTLAAVLAVLLLAGQQAGRSAGLARRAATRRDPVPTTPHRAI